MSQREIWNERYSGDAWLYGEEPNEFLVREAARLKPSSHILAVADGEGRNGVFLAEQGHRVVSFDISERAREKAGRLAESRGVSLDLQVMDVDQQPWPESSYDAVAAIFIQFAPPDQRSRIFEGMKRCLKPGGLLLLQGYRPEQLQHRTGGPGELENLYTEELLRGAFSDFEIESLTLHDWVISEGARHRGMSCLIDLVARKPGQPGL